MADTNRQKNLGQNFWILQDLLSGFDFYVLQSAGSKIENAKNHLTFPKSSR